MNKSLIPTLPSFNLIKVILDILIDFHSNSLNGATSKRCSNVAALHCLDLLCCKINILILHYWVRKCLETRFGSVSKPLQGGCASLMSLKCPWKKYFVLEIFMSLKSPWSLRLIKYCPWNVLELYLMLNVKKIVQFDIKLSLGHQIRCLFKGLVK